MRSVFIGLIGVFVLPLFVLVFVSFAPSWNYPTLIPTEFNLQAWTQLLKGKIGQATLNSLYIALSVAIISTIIGFPSGRILVSLKHFASEVLQTLILFPALLPPLMLAIGIQFLFIKINLSGTIQGVIIAHLIVTLPYATLISIGFFSNFNFNYELQARTLGANGFQVLWRVTSRMLSAGAISVFLFSFLISWSQFALTIQIGAGRIQTIPMLAFSYLEGGNLQFSSASTVVMILPTILILFVSSKSIEKMQTWQVK